MLTWSSSPQIFHNFSTLQHSPSNRTPYAHRRRLSSSSSSRRCSSDRTPCSYRRRRYHKFSKIFENSLSTHTATVFGPIHHRRQLLQHSGQLIVATNAHGVRFIASSSPNFSNFSLPLFSNYSSSLPAEANRVSTGLLLLNGSFCETSGLGPGSRTLLSRGKTPLPPRFGMTLRDR